MDENILNFIIKLIDASNSTEEEKEKRIRGWEEMAKEWNYSDTKSKR